MRIVLCVISFFFITISAIAQEEGIFFQSPGSITVNGGFFFASHPASVTSPKFLSGEYVIIRNISAGPIITHYKLKEHLAFNQTTYTTKFPTDNIKIHQLLIGLKGTFYMNDLLKQHINLNLSKKADVHVTIFGGKNLTFGKVEATEISTDSIPEFALGVFIGTRYYYNEFLGFFFEAGYSNYGFLSFGASYILKRH